MSLTSDKNKNYKEPSTSDNSSSSTYVVNEPDNENDFYATLADALANGKQTYNYNSSTTYGTISEEQVNTYLLSRDVVIDIKCGTAKMSVYEYLKIKYLVESNGKKLKNITKDELDVYLTTVRL